MLNETSIRRELLLQALMPGFGGYIYFSSTFKREVRSLSTSSVAIWHSPLLSRQQASVVQNPKLNAVLIEPLDVFRS